MLARISTALLFACAAAAADDAAAAAAAAPAPDDAATNAVTVVSDASHRTFVALTVYNDDLVLIREKRRVRLPPGLVRLQWRDAAASLQPHTATFSAVDGPPLTLLEQNFDSGRLSAAALLAAHVGRETSLVHTHPDSGAQSIERVVVLAADGAAPLLQTRLGVESGLPPNSRIVYDAAPSHLQPKPLLSLLLQGDGGEQTLQLASLASGMSWRADYVARLSRNRQHIDLSGWVTLDNRSGAAFAAAHLQLVAGRVHRVAQTLRPTRAKMMAFDAAAAMPQAQTLLDYSLYRYARPITITDQQSKQLALNGFNDVAVRHEYLIHAANYDFNGRRDEEARIKAVAFLSFDNPGEGAAALLPAGVVRVYAEDDAGAAQFVGEDRITHTAGGDTLRLQLGQAHDIYATRTQTKRHRINDHELELSWRIEAHNKGAAPVRVELRETPPGEWRLLQQQPAVTASTAQRLTWLVDIAAGASKQIEYTLRLRR